MLLARDVLDTQLLDRTEQNVGKVDGVVLELRDGRPPRVVAVEVGPITLARRISVRLAGWVARLDARFGAGRGVPFRIPWAKLERRENVFVVHIDAERSPLFAVERWLRDHVVRRIPGSG